MLPLIISFSGGKTSAYMTYLLIKKYSGKRVIVVIFANTGKERNETLDFVNNCDIHFGFNTIWIEGVTFQNQTKSSGYKIVDFATADRTGIPFEDMINKYGIPNKTFPHCTRELKINPIASYIKDLGYGDAYEMGIGIRADEPRRLTVKPNIIYPLAYEFPTTKLMVAQWWDKQPFNLQLKDHEGNCDMCWKKSKIKLLTSIVEDPDYITWWHFMEETYKEFVPPSQRHSRLTPIHFFRGNESAKDLIELSKTPFTLFKDKHTKENLNYTSPNIDFTDPCEESCEAV